MRNFSLRKKQSKIRTLAEPPKKQPKKNWQQVSWLLILVGGIAYAIFRVYTTLALISGTGMVELEKQEVQFTDDIEILKIYVGEGEIVDRGDTLFLYKEESQETIGQSSFSVDKPIEWLIRDQLNMEKQLALKKIEQENLRMLIDLKKEELKRQKDMILLGVKTANLSIVEIQETIELSQAKLKLIRKERSILRKHLKVLKSQANTIKKYKVNQIAESSTPIYYIAKMDGIIGQINMKENEVCYEKQNVMTIHQMDKVSIKGYFNQDEIAHLAIGDYLDIAFPGGSKSKGYIQNFYISTYELPDEFQKKYEPTQRNIVVEILPVNKNDVIKWEKFYKMTVTLSKSRYLPTP